MESRFCSKDSIRIKEVLLTEEEAGIMQSAMQYQAKGSFGLLSSTIGPPLPMAPTRRATDSGEAEMDCPQAYPHSWSFSFRCSPESLYMAHLSRPMVLALLMASSNIFLFVAISSEYKPYGNNPSNGTPHSQQKRPYSPYKSRLFNVLMKYMLLHIRADSSQSGYGHEQFHY